MMWRIVRAALLAALVPTSLASAYTTAPVETTPAAWFPQPYRSGLTLLTAPPTAVVPPATIVLRFAVHGADVDTKTQLWARATPLDEPRFAGPVATIPSPTLSASPGLSLSFGQYQPLTWPACERGGVDTQETDGWYLLGVPARATGTLTVTMAIPVGFAGSAVSASIGAGPQEAFANPRWEPQAGADLPVQFETPVTLTRSGRSVEGVHLHLERSRSGGLIATGSLRSRRAGVAVEIVGKRPFAADVPPLYVLGSAAAAMSPRLHRIATTRTTTGGRFRVAVETRHTMIVVARTRRAGLIDAGASCPHALRPASRAAGHA